MSSRAVRWFAGMVAGLFVLSLISLMPVAGLPGAQTSRAQVYSVPPNTAVAGQAGAEQPSPTPKPWWAIFFGG